MTHTIEIIDGMMVVIDEDGNSFDGHLLETGLRDAKRKIQEWTREYTFDVAAAYHLLSDYYEACK